MSFKRLDPEDFLISTDAVIAGAFAGGSIDATATEQANSGVSAEYYAAFAGDDGRVEYAVTEGDKDAETDGVPDPAQVVYRQFANIITGDSDGDLAVGSTFKAIIVERSRFKQALFPPAFFWGENVPT